MNQTTIVFPPPKWHEKCKYCGKLLEGSSIVFGYIKEDETFCWDQFCSYECSDKAKQQEENV